MGLICPYPKLGKAFFYGLSQVMGYEGYVLRGCRLYIASNCCINSTYSTCRQNMPLDPLEQPEPRICSAVHNEEPSPPIHSQHQASSQMTSHKGVMKRKGRSPDDTSRYCSSKVIAPPGCKQSPGDRGGKN
ncbi:hypothetical protein C8Q73DRAFT_485415 [Cubamyces lactineus]|nr:hypothetical protein C8Q73DRAFT_485415 [Cubamyces lactineus]